ncbi:hypothetical protein FNV43_RR04896 [Rhamnella rubrinervis]|uniref:Uncharacterized protein n=1 Tax=Rhamnella rubrinervis TaxID=2594499 RepID=A0A8K0HLP1_9ROSA|nr:hypothetical protein FNV43_RR04896 [Rhamnella rubrinervis]
MNGVNDSYSPHCCGELFFEDSSGLWPHFWMLKSRIANNSSISFECSAFLRVSFRGGNTPFQLSFLGRSATGPRESVPTAEIWDTVNPIFANGPSRPSSFSPWLAFLPCVCGLHQLHPGELIYTLIIIPVLLQVNEGPLRLLDRGEFFLLSSVAAILEATLLGHGLWRGSWK